MELQVLVDDGRYGDVEVQAIEGRTLAEYGGRSEELMAPMDLRSLDFGMSAG